MASESDKLRREARDLIASLRKVTPILLMEAARLVELRAEDQSIAPSHVQGLFEQLRVLGWDGVPREHQESDSWDWVVVLRCKLCGETVRSQAAHEALAPRRLASHISSPRLHSDYPREAEPHCRGLLEVLGLSR